MVKLLSQRAMNNKITGLKICCHIEFRPYAKSFQIPVGYDHPALCDVLSQDTVLPVVPEKMTAHYG